MNAGKTGQATVRVLMVGLLGLATGCAGFPFGNTNGNQNSNGANGNANGNQGGGSLDDLPDLTTNDTLGTGEGEDVAVPGLILVGFDQNIDDALFAQAVNTVATTISGTLLDEIPDIRWATYVVPEGSEQQAISIAELIDSVEFVETDAGGRLAEVTDLLPNANSVEFGQYQLFLTGAIQARGIASAGTGSISVAVLDSGVDLSHPEFQGAGVVAGGNYVDATGGILDEVGGGHGTAVVSLLAANNSTGEMAGLLPGFSVSVHKVATADGVCPLDSVVLGIVGAVNGNTDSDLTTAEIAPADVLYLGCSFSGNYASLRRVISWAEDRPAVVIAPAGNNGRNGTAALSSRYPAGYDTVVSVGASDIEEKLAVFSNRSGLIDIVAPGVDLLVAAPGSTYRYADGTSFAAAQVAAGAAWVWDRNPGLTVSELRDRLRTRGDTLASGGGSGSFSAKRLNFVSLLLDEDHPPEPFIISDQDLVAATGVSRHTLVSNQAGHSSTGYTAEAFSNETIYWYGYFPGHAAAFELADGDQRISLTVESLVSSRIDLFLDFVRGITLGDVTAYFSVLDQAVVKVPDLGGARRTVQVVAVSNGVESDPQSLIYNPLKKGYNVLAYKNFDSSAWFSHEEIGQAFNPGDADIQLLGSGSQPEINWSGEAAHTIQLGSDLDPTYYVTSEGLENQIEPSVQLGECVGAVVPEQLCGNDIVLPENQISRIVVERSGTSSDFAVLELIYVP